MVQQISLIDKKSHQEIKPEGELGKIKFPQKKPSVIKINASPEDIKAYKQEGSDLVVTLKNGEVLRVDGFFEADHSLVLEDAVTHQLKWVEFTANGDALDATYKSLENTDSLLYDNDLNPAWVAVPLAAGGIIAWAGKSLGSSDNEKGANGAQVKRARLV